MNVDLIAQIKEAESKADEIIRKASEEARKIVLDAQKDAQSAKAGAQSSIVKDNEVALAAATEEAEAEKSKILAEADKGVEAMEFLVKPKIARAAEFIIERIVG